MASESEENAAKYDWWAVKSAIGTRKAPGLLAVGLLLDN